MRDIKFRAWAGNPKSMRTVCELVDASNYFRISTGYILGDVMQFTGLHDKNGKEIYEGDIVRFEVHDGAVVIWNNVCACFEFKAIKHYCESDISLPCEVVGNIHQSPELLK